MRRLRRDPSPSVTPQGFQRAPGNASIRREESGIALKGEFAAHFLLFAWRTRRTRVTERRSGVEPWDG
ncbi:hypothetical protein SKAU_G00368180 [Synaphobranchus kaupii]|uniref:Uncharacterized protein n=1 Tax=Synaphobranchus kaupii TaxID=118154 RepID=A0A9Q1EFI3_SYNKA|nr:hypothetical protein SKAU_G00368180 [Synaphobranchus kaupii]